MYDDDDGKKKYISTATVSWKSNPCRIRVYSYDGKKIIEKSWDDGGSWVTTPYTFDGQTVGATSWEEHGIHIRLYISNKGKISEYCWDGDVGWKKGTLSCNGDAASATTWLDGGIRRVRVYVSESNDSKSDDKAKVKEYCWDGQDWNKGAYEDD